MQKSRGKQGTALLRSLAGIVSAHQDLGYDGGRKVMFADVDDLDNDDVVACIYTGKTIAKVTDARTAYQGGDGLNAEHTWPQSMGAVGAARADLHHLFPSDCRANSTRSSFPFGEVKSVEWSSGGSKLGLDAKGNRVFEPQEVQKGNTARAIFYFYTVYGRNNVNLSNFRIEEETLKRWNAQDPVTADEALRNDLVFRAQGNRNPFVDHPEFVAQVGNFLAEAKLVDISPLRR